MRAIEQIDVLHGETEAARDWVVAEVNKACSSMSAVERIRYIYRGFDASRITATTSGGKTSAILPHLTWEALAEWGQRLPDPFSIVFVDTLLHRRSTLNHIMELKRRGEEHGYTILTYAPTITLDDLTRRNPQWSAFGTPDFSVAKELLKKEPLQRAFRVLGTRVWVSGIMRDKHASRSDAPFFGWDKQHQLFTLHPLADWTQEMAIAYIQNEHLPVNLDHRDPFKGEMQNEECGIHSL